MQRRRFVTLCAGTPAMCFGVLSCIYAMPLLRTFSCGFNLEEVDMRVMLGHVPYQTTTHLSLGVPLPREYASCCCHHLRCWLPVAHAHALADTSAAVCPLTTTSRASLGASPPSQKSSKHPSRSPSLRSWATGSPFSLCFVTNPSPLLRIRNLKNFARRLLSRSRASSLVLPHTSRPSSKSALSASACIPPAFSLCLRRHLSCSVA